MSLFYLVIFNPKVKKSKKIYRITFNAQNSYFFTSPFVHFYCRWGEYHREIAQIKHVFL